MGKYILRRLLWMIPIILGVSVIVFSLMTVCPGDPAQIILGSSSTGAELEAMRETLGLNKPFLIRLGEFLSDTFIRFDLGTSWLTQADIKTDIMTRLPRTFILTVAILSLSLLAGVPLGIIAAINQGKLADNVCMALSLLGAAMPNFWLALLLIILFSVKLGILPSMGFEGFEYYILPALTGCAGGIATFARQTRSSMLDVIRADYITTARSKGVPEWQVITKHALKNALIPVITIAGTYFGALLGGTMITETIFAIPGMGTFIITGVNNRDIPVIQAGALFMSIVFSLCMLMVDLLYAVVDPRIKAQYEGKKRKVKKNAG